EMNTGGDFANNIGGTGSVVKSGDEDAHAFWRQFLTPAATDRVERRHAGRPSNVEALGTGDVTDNATLELNTGGDFDNA
ncbi:ShdA, partial [Salmonella enterica subsp. enterica serovar Agona str. SA-4]